MYNKLYIFLFFLLIISCSTAGNGRIDFGFSENMLLKFDKHDIEVTIHPDINIAYFTDKISVDFSIRKNKYSGSFLLDNNMDLYSVSVNGSNQMVRVVERFSEEYFGSEFTDTQLEFIKYHANIYEVELPQLDDTDQTLELTIKYTIKVTDETECSTSASDSFILKDKYFWFPTDWKNGSDLSIKVKAPKRFSIEINDKSGTIEDLSDIDNSTYFQLKNEGSTFLKGFIK